jgi:ketosteroid isomerase-like protein
MFLHRDLIARQESAMGRMLVFIGIFGALCCSGFAQSKEKGPAGAEQAVMRIERELLNAIMKGDASASERHLANTYVFTAPDGTVQNKAQAVADLKSGALKLQSATLDGARVQVYGDTAIVTYSSNDKGTYKGRDISGKTRWTDVFVNQGGRWQVVAAHGCMLPK